MKNSKIQKETLLNILGNRINFVNGGKGLGINNTRADINYTIFSNEPIENNTLMYRMCIKIRRNESDSCLKISESTIEKLDNGFEPTKKVIHQNIEGCIIPLSEEQYQILKADWQK